MFNFYLDHPRRWCRPYCCCMVWCGGQPALKRLLNHPKARRRSPAFRKSHYDYLFPLTVLPQTSTWFDNDDEIPVPNKMLWSSFSSLHSTRIYLYVFLFTSKLLSRMGPRPRCFVLPNSHTSDCGLAVNQRVIVENGVEWDGGQKVAT